MTKLPYILSLRKPRRNIIGDPFWRIHRVTVPYCVPGGGIEPPTSGL